MIQKVLRKWGSLSIRYKTTVLCMTFILPMLVLIGTLFMEFWYYHTQTDAILSEYGSCLGYSSALQKEAEQVGQTVYSGATERALSLCVSAQKRSDSFLEQIRPNYKRDDYAVLEIKQVIQRSMQSYRQRQERFFLALKEGNFDTKTFADLQTQSAYLERYADTLTQSLLLSGQSSYLALGRQLTTHNMALIFLLTLCIIGLAAGSTLLIYSIVSPVRRVSEAAMQVSLGQYDLPDIQYKQTDEIGQMAKSFNDMKRQIIQTIHALEAEAKMEKDLRRHEKEEARLSRLVEQSRFAQLQSQINPHFLFNTLQGIANMAELEQAAVCEDMLLRLSRFFRYTLETDEDLVPLERELELLRDYISLQELRFGERIAFEMDCGPACVGLTVPKFILQPLVENAIIHGMKQRSSGGRIRIKCRRPPDGCCITVTDNGCGFRPDDPPPNHPNGRRSIGLQNIAERVSIRGGAFRLYSHPGWGTCVRIKIPERSEQND